MSTARFTDLTPITAARAGDVLALDNAGPGSAQILVKDALGGRLLAYGFATLSTASSAALQTVGFGSTLPEVPSHVDFSFLKLAAATDVPIGVLVIDTISTTQFQIQLTGTLSDNTSYSVFWRAWSFTT
jgi:hypothetical protein